MISCSYDDTIKIWEEDDYDWTCKQSLEGHTSTVWGVAFSEDGNMIYSCSDDKTVIVWELDQETSEYKRKSTLSGHHERSIYALDVNASNIIVTACGDDSIRLFEQDSDSMEVSYQLLTNKEKAHESDVNTVAWHPTLPNIFASGSDDNTVKLWKLLN